MTSASKDIQVKYFVDQNALIRYSMGSTGRCKKPLYWSSDCMGAQKHLEQLPLPLEIWKLRRYSMLFPWILLKQFTRAFDTCAFNNFRLRLPPAKRISFRWRGQSSLSGNTPVVPMSPDLLWVLSANVFKSSLHSDAGFYSHKYGTSTNALHIVPTNKCKQIWRFWCHRWRQQYDTSRT